MARIMPAAYPTWTGCALELPRSHTGYPLPLLGSPGACGPRYTIVPAGVSSAVPGPVTEDPSDDSRVVGGVGACGTALAAALVATEVLDGGAGGAAG